MCAYRVLVVIDMHLHMLIYVHLDRFYPAPTYVQHLVQPFPLPCVVAANSRAYLGWFNFKSADQQKKVNVLSGGERNRLNLARTLKQVFYPLAKPKDHG